MPFLSVVALTFDIQTHPSEGSNTHAFPVNLAQSRLAVPGISHRPTRTNFVNCVRFCFLARLRHAPKTEPYAVHEDNPFLAQVTTSK